MSGAPYQYDPKAFAPAVAPTAHGSVCLRCGLFVVAAVDENLVYAQMRHHDWHVALDAAVSAAGAAWGHLQELSRLRP